MKSSKKKRTVTTVGHGESEVKIYTLRNRAGYESFQCCWYDLGKRQTKTFGDREAAPLFAQQKTVGVATVVAYYSCKSSYSMSKEQNEAVLAAVQSGDTRCLLSLGLEFKEYENADLLHYAAQLGNPEIIEVLLNRGWLGMLNTFDDVGFTPLHWAAMGSHLSAMEKLIIAGADVNAHNDSCCGNTPLREVIGTAPIDVVMLLLKHGAQPSISGWMQFTALDIAEQRVKEHKDDLSIQILDAVKMME